MENLPPVALALDQLQIPYRLFTHPGPIHSLEQAARERGHLPDQVVRSIVFRVGKADFVMVLIAGDRQVAWPTLRKYLGQSRLTMATEAEVKAATGYERGAYHAYIYPDAAAQLRAWYAQGKRLYVYSSGSITARQLFFAIVELVI